MFVFTSVIVTVAPGTASPDVSVTLPSSVPVTACARADDGVMSTAAMTTATAMDAGRRSVAYASDRLRHMRFPPSREEILRDFSSTDSNFRILNGLVVQ